MTRYRRGYRQTTRAILLPHRVVQGELDDPRDLHPFVVVRDGRVYVLDELRKTGPIYRHFASRDELDNPPSLAPRWRPPTPVAADGPATVHVREITPAVVSPARGLLPVVGLFGAVALAVCGLIAALAITVVMLGPTEDSARRPTATGPMAEAPVAACPVHARADIAVERDLPRLLSGAPVQWGTPASEVEQGCGALRRVPLPSCAADFVDIRATGWGPTLDIPSRRETQLAFHPTRGLFEVMVWSDADAEALAAAVEQRLGAPHRTERRHRFWSYPAGDGSPTTRLKVSPLPDGHARGRSAIRLHYPQTADAYAAEMRAAGCQH